MSETSISLLNQVGITILERFGATDVRLEPTGQTGKFRYFAWTKQKSYRNGSSPELEVGVVNIK